MSLELLPDKNLIREDFRTSLYNDETILDKLRETSQISAVSRALGIPYDEVIKCATRHNVAIPWQPKARNQEGKYRGRIGEILFLAMFDAVDMNDIEPNHPDYDFEYMNALVEIKSTSPKDGYKGSAKLTQGAAPDVYLVFRFNNMGVLRNAYLLPVNVIMFRPKGIPKNITIDKNQWCSRFEIPLHDLEVFFKINKYYQNYFKNPPIATPPGVESKSQAFDKLSEFLTSDNKLSVDSLFSNGYKWWLNMFSARVYYVRYFGRNPEWSW
ncbi:TPA: hypothetical protein ACMDP6_004480 [Vibrio parahaemolyticus]|nr:hypothetical protein [Vibrio parahaemolyticus]EIU6780211.1 hypothetical protein [Vibrio parahaemolyticus]MBM5087308.1 hypothetical protein [Vibrio parahaemolyticus]